MSDTGGARLDARLARLTAERDAAIERTERAEAERDQALEFYSAALSDYNREHARLAAVRALVARWRATSRQCRGCDAGHELRGVGARMPPSHYEAGRWIMWCQATPESRVLAARLAEVLGE